MNDDEPFLSDAELDALDAEIGREMQLLRAMDDDLMAKVRRFRAEVMRRMREVQRDVVRQLPRRDPDADRPRPGVRFQSPPPEEPEPGDFRPRPSGQPPYDPPDVHGDGGHEPSST
jgi:hypothetical protein